MSEPSVHADHEAPPPPDEGMEATRRMFVLQRRAEDESVQFKQTLERRTAQLLAANEELQAFGYAVSHDLRAPLRHIVGFAELLRRDAAATLSESALRYVSTISQAATRMAQLIDGLLAFSRLGRSELDKIEVDLDDLVHECVREFQALTEARNIDWSIGPLPAVRADRALLKIVLVNLLSNAVKFTDARQQARIEIGCVYGEDGERVIFVRDNGTGFDPRYAGKLFGVFQRLHAQDEFEGIGIGLANAQRIIHKHGGRIWAEGIVDGGATLYFSLPGLLGSGVQRPWIGSAGLAPPAPGQPQPQPQALRSRSVPVQLLMVEDSEDDTQLLLHVLADAGFHAGHRRVQSIADLETALATERWDAVISDFKLPGLTGMDALLLVRATGLDIPFILVSGTIGEDVAVAAMKAGASDYIMKNSLARLAPALERELGEAQLRSAHRASERDLVESEERFRGLTALSSDWYWEQDENLRFALATPVLRHKYQQALDAWAGKGRWQPPYWNAEWNQSRALIEAELPFHEVELEPFMYDGKQVFISVSGEPRFDTDGKFRGYRGVGRDITAQVRSVDELRRFHAAMDAIADAIFFIDRSSMCFVHVNDASCRLLGLTREQVLALDPWSVWGTLTGSRAELEGIYDTLIARGGVAEILEFLWHRTDGPPVWLDLRRHAQRLRGRWTIVVLVRDITERKQAEARLRRLNHILVTVSAIDALVVRARDRDELFRNACRVALEQGEFEKAWIAVIDPAVGRLVMVGSAGLDDKSEAAIRAVLASSAGSPQGNMLAARAMREKTALVSHDLQNDQEVVIGRNYVASGLHSLALIPMLLADTAVGVIVLVTSKREFFDPQGLKLLTDVAGNIAFAKDYIDKQAQLDYLAYYDAPTGLANRRLFLDRFAQYLRSAAGGKHQLALFVLDLERFRGINDSLGRAAGDSLLRQVAQWLTQFAADPNVLARVGADQFAVVLPEVTRPGNVARLLEKAIGDFMNHPFTLGDAAYRIAAKVGVVLFPDDGDDADTLFKHAEAALKKAKVSGDRYLFYAQKMSETLAGRLGFENELRQALDKQQFVLHYQPKFDLLDGRLTGAEALIRWNRPGTGLVAPVKFIPILEQTGLIQEVGRWALRCAVSEYLRWLGTGLPPVPIAVNVSPLQLRNRGFVAEIAQAIGNDPHAAAGMELEITESLIMEDINHSIGSLQSIRAMGVSIAIDDFGTGFSSLSYLSKLPVDTLKIDRSFVNDMAAGRSGPTLVSVIINLAHALKLKVVAEGVETQEQMRQLKSLDCDEVQGFLCGRPVPGDVFESTYLDRARGRPNRTPA